MNNRVVLNNEYSLLVENQGKIARLVVLEKGNEFVCRREKKSLLQNFLQQSAGHIFKGRLQLNKFEKTINIMVKGRIVGTANAEDIEELINV